MTTAVAVSRSFAVGSTSAGREQLVESAAQSSIPAFAGLRQSGTVEKVRSSRLSKRSNSQATKLRAVADVNAIAETAVVDTGLGYIASSVGALMAGVAIFSWQNSTPESEEKKEASVVVAEAKAPAASTNGAYTNGAAAAAAAQTEPEMDEKTLEEFMKKPAFPLGKRQAAPAAVETMDKHFPEAQIMEDFIHAIQEELFKQGFNKNNCIAMVNTCRDEVCRPIVNLIDEEFGQSFNIAGLGGLVNCGRTGFLAGMSHSPEHPCESDGNMRERYIFFAFPHISIGETGQEGSLLRRGRGKPSSACGALIAVKEAAKSAKDESNEPYPPDDFEYTLLRRKVLSKKQAAATPDGGPSLVDVTKAALEVINEDLEYLISKTVDPATADYAVVTGVQIHSGWQLDGEPFRLDRTVDYIAPDKVYAVIRGEKREMSCAPRSKLVYA
jgi:hypothetical protein